MNNSDGVKTELGATETFFFKTKSMWKGFVNMERYGGK